MIISTTQSIDGRSVGEYLGIVTANQVVGTNIVSDLVASFSDFFGGNSGTYREQMNDLYRNAMERLEKKAGHLHADAVIGVRIDFDEISGKNKSMFMVSISGTAVRFKEDGLYERNIVDGGEVMVSNDRLKAMKIVDDIKNGRTKEDKVDWAFLTANRIIEPANELFKMRKWIGNVGNYIHAHSEEFWCEFDSKLKVYLSVFSEETQAMLVYDNLIDNPEFCKNYIRRRKLFYPKLVLEILDKNVRDAIDLLDTEKEYYTDDDFRQMKELEQRLDNLPELGHVEEKKSVFSSGVSYVCQCGHHMSIDDDFCSFCGKNKYGLYPSHVEGIKAYKDKLTMLETLISKTFSEF